MRRKNQHVIPIGNGWAVKKEGSDRFTVITETKKQALEVARELARSSNSGLVIHGRDGKIQEESNGKRHAAAKR